MELRPIGSPVNRIYGDTQGRELNKANTENVVPPMVLIYPDIEHVVNEQVRLSSWLKLQAQTAATHLELKPLSYISQAKVPEFEFTS